MHVGQHGTYRVPETHHAGETGSIHHPAKREFFAIVGHVNAEVKGQKAKGDAPAVAPKAETADIALIVPGSASLVWAYGVLEGEDAGEFAPEKTDAAAAER